jgi:hypothetical protein
MVVVVVVVVGQKQRFRYSRSIHKIEQGNAPRNEVDLKSWTKMLWLSYSTSV